jgi:predicted nucleotide-binding protein
MATADASNDDILAAVNSSTEEIREALRREREPTHEEIADQDLRGVIELLQNQTDKLVAQALNVSHVDLRLDDLFVVVTRLTPEATKIEAVDLEIDRWMNDPRAKRYLDKNLLALQKGANIERVYVISPGITEAMMAGIQKTLIRHLSWNENEDVKKEKGRLDIGVIYHEDLPDPKDLRDFAIFDGDKALVEEFSSNWTSKFRGALTKDAVAVKETHNHFTELWKQAEKLGSLNAIVEWADRTRNRIARRGFKQDVFLGYCGEARPTATSIKDYIHDEGYTVRDWKKFPAGPALLGEIDRACRECRLGLFLLTKDDLKANGDFTPRDNVVFELGYFLSAKGDERVAVILEEGAQQPTDIEGNIWITLTDPNNIDGIHHRLSEWLKNQLGPAPDKPAS